MNKYPSREARLQFFEDLLRRLVSVPDFHAVGLTSALPFSGFDSQCTVELERRGAGIQDQLRTSLRAVSNSYFRAMAVPLREGRHFSGKDDWTVSPVAIINEKMARLLQLDNVIGSRITLVIGRERRVFEIIGIVGDVRHESLGSSTTPEVYVPHLQFSPTTFMFLVIRTKADSHLYIPTVRKAIVASGYTEPIDHIQLMETLVADSIAEQLFYTKVLTFFGALSVILAGLGIYGILSYSVAQRTHDIGIRIALGASRKNILRLVIRQGLVIVLFGLILGSLIASTLTRLIGSFLYGVTPTDSFTFAIVSLLFGIVGLLACCMPAYRAFKIDPFLALRYE